MQIQMNDRMARFYSPDGTSILPAILEELLGGGFVAREGCAFFRKFAERNEIAPSEARKMYFDDIGYECFVNHFHFTGESEKALTSAAMGFCRRACSEWTQSGFTGGLRFIISIDEMNARYGFTLFERALNGFTMI